MRRIDDQHLEDIPGARADGDEFAKLRNAEQLVIPRFERKPVSFNEVFGRDDVRAGGQFRNHDVLAVLDRLQRGASALEMNNVNNSCWRPKKLAKYRVVKSFWR